MKKIMVLLKPLSVFLGTVIGVGIFGLPFVAQKAGFSVILIYFLFMVLVAISTHLIFGEVALGTKEIHRLPGYTGKYLGEKWKKISFLVISTGLFGALLAYLIIGGQFLDSLLSPYIGGSAIFYTFLFFIAGSFLVFRGIKSISEIEIFLLAIFLSIIAMFLVKSLPFINFNNFQNTNSRYLTFPFGIVLFSLWGTAIVPEIKEIIVSLVSGRNKVRVKLKEVIIGGLISAVFIYLLFVFIILGVSGSHTSEEAISGMGRALGANSNIIKLGFVFGIICCFTSFLTLALTLKKIFWYDFGLSKNFSWFLTCFAPLIVFLLGVQRFIGVINFTGAIAVGSEGIIIVFLYRSFLKEKFGRKMNKFFYFLVPVFILGIIFEIAYLL